MSYKVSCPSSFILKDPATIVPDVAVGNEITTSWRWVASQSSNVPFLLLLYYNMERDN